MFTVGFGFGGFGFVGLCSLVVGLGLWCCFGGFVWLLVILGWWLIVFS